MRLGITVFTLIIFFSCDSPQRTRSPYKVPTGSNISDIDDSEKPKNEDIKTEDKGDVKDKEADGNKSTGFENCNLNPTNFLDSVGSFAICQSSLDETKFRVKMSLSDTLIGTCFVPIHIESNNAAFKLGIPECVNNEANREYPMTVTKERAEKINGIMLVKANALNSYIECTSAKVEFINGYAPRCAYDASCLKAADDYARSVCSQFAQTFYGYYKQVSF